MQVNDGNRWIASSQTGKNSANAVEDFAHSCNCICTASTISRIGYLHNSETVLLISNFLGSGADI